MIDEYLLIIGFGIFCSFVFPSLNGPGNVLKFFRDKIGKPFTCPTCALIWGVFIGMVILPVINIHIVVEWIFTSVGLSGWGLAVLHIAGYNIIFQGMEDE